MLKTACILLSVIIGDLEAALIPLLLNWLRENFMELIAVRCSSFFVTQLCYLNLVARSKQC